MSDGAKATVIPFMSDAANGDQNPAERLLLAEAVRMAE
ncbi:MAG: SMC-Scp complex subunit ScpB, partial [Pseudaminobacter sp.]|nr:SMC-Scp complex subunit ScpB [Pseudaminobacter sp.]